MAADELTYRMPPSRARTIETTETKGNVMSQNPNTSPIGTLSFPHLFTPRSPSPGADERYSVTLIFDAEAQGSAEYKAMKKAVMDAATEKWGAKAKDMISNGQIRMPFRDAEEKSQYAGYETGKVFINAWGKRKPDVIDGRLATIEVPSDVFPGCRGRITYNAFAYENSGNRGVSFGLNNVQITDFTSERLDGAKKGRDDFDALDMPEPGEGAGGGDLDDDMPF